MFKQEAIYGDNFSFSIYNSISDYTIEERKEIVELLTTFSNRKRNFSVFPKRDLPKIELTTNSYHIGVSESDNYFFDIELKGLELGGRAISYESLAKLYEKYLVDYEKYDEYFYFKKLK